MMKISESMPQFRILMISGGEPFLGTASTRSCRVREEQRRVVDLDPDQRLVPRQDRAGVQGVPRTRRHHHAHAQLLGRRPARHAPIRGKPETFDNLCTTLESMLRGASATNLRFRVNSVVTPDNIGEIRATVDYFYERFDLDEHGIEIIATSTPPAPRLARAARHRR
jgi:hypothetical protein